MFRLIPLLTLLLTSLAALVAPASPPRSEPRHYVFFGRERDRIHQRSFLDTPAIAGAQLKYLWRELEPRPGVYTVRAVLDDLMLLERHGKRLVLQLQDVTFDSSQAVPSYLLRDEVYGGGVAPQFDAPDDDSTRARFAGWVARRWDPAVHARFVTLLDTLGRVLDGRIEVLVLPESSVDFGLGARHVPAGFTPAGYAACIRERMSAAQRAFPRSGVIQYANFMPGEWLPWEDHGHLRSLYAHAESIGAGVGGPDLMPHRRGQRQHSLPLIAARGARVRAGVAVQDGNLAERHPTTGRPVTVAGLTAFARDTLRLDYVFWGTEEPYFTRDVLPFLRRLPSPPMAR
jgi:hypothetical protein